MKVSYGHNPRRFFHELQQGDVFSSMDNQEELFIKMEGGKDAVEVLSGEKAQFSEDEKVIWHKNATLLVNGEADRC